MNKDTYGIKHFWINKPIFSGGGGGDSHNLAIDGGNLSKDPTLGNGGSGGGSFQADGSAGQGWGAGGGGKAGSVNGGGGGGGGGLLPDYVFSDATDLVKNGDFTNPGIPVDANGSTGIIIIVACPI